MRALSTRWLRGCYALVGMRVCAFMCFSCACVCVHVCGGGRSNNNHIASYRLI